MRPATALTLARPRLRTGGATLVLALHALAMLGALRLGVWDDRQPPPREQPPLMVWLSEGPPPARTVPPEAAPAASPRKARTPRETRDTREPPRRREAQAITLPAAAPNTPAADAAASAKPHTAPAAKPAPLNLVLPRAASAPWRERNPALDDTRSNSPRPTLESRIAAALGGSDRITEFRLEDGSVRLRRGTACVIARPNRAGALDPFNASSQLRPRLLDPC